MPGHPTKGALAQLQEKEMVSVYLKVGGSKKFLYYCTNKPR